MSATVTKIQTGEGAMLREIRLRALVDSPYTLASALSEEEAFPVARWNALGLWQSSKFIKECKCIYEALSPVMT